jgi:hypothetical protein
MAGNKYLKLNSGVPTEEAALQTSAGAGDAGKIVALDSTGKIDSTMMPTGIGADTASIVSSENLAAGDFVNIYDDGGTPTARKADATTAGKEAHGFVLAGVTAPAAATVYFEGSNDQVSGAVAGKVYLATTAGGFVAAAPSASGNVVQQLGVATSATSINVEFGQHYVLA